MRDDSTIADFFISLAVGLAVFFGLLWLGFSFWYGADAIFECIVNPNR